MLLDEARRTLRRVVAGESPPAAREALRERKFAVVILASEVRLSYDWIARLSKGDVSVVTRSQDDPNLKITVRSDEGSGHRSKDVPKAIGMRLAGYLRRCDDGGLFTTQGGRRLGREAIRKVVEQWARHGAASLCPGEDQS